VEQRLELSKFKHSSETFLTGFDGILQIDGYQGYNRLTKPTRKGGTPIRVAHC
jgi:hypothetical protein